MDPEIPPKYSRLCEEVELNTFLQKYCCIIKYKTSLFSFFSWVFSSFVLSFGSIAANLTTPSVVKPDGSVWVCVFRHLAQNVQSQIGIFCRVVRNQARPREARSGMATLIGTARPGQLTDRCWPCFEHPAGSACLTAITAPGDLQVLSDFGSIRLLLGWTGSLSLSAGRGFAASPQWAAGTRPRLPSTPAAHNPTALQKRAIDGGPSMVRLPFRGTAEPASASFFWDNIIYFKSVLRWEPANATGFSSRTRVPRYHYLGVLVL